MILPYLTSSVAPIPAELRAVPEDFEVTEIPAYAPSGHGEHVFLWIEKRELTTRDAVRRLCATLGTDPRGAGWAGLKDRRAVTRQWISLAGTSPEAAKRAEAPGVRVLEAAFHTHKLRTGHLRGNRFRIRLRGVDSSRGDDLRRVLSLLRAHGLPNYYGEQRFGRGGDNAVRALRWLRGESRPPSRGFERKLEMSALQSDLFNRFNAFRVESSTLGEIQVGELVKKHDSGGLFVVEDPAEAQARADAWEISPTGPIFGVKMRWPAGEARAREEALLSEAGLTREQFVRWKRIAPGTRRFVRVPVSDLDLELNDGVAQLDFTLPAGSYATILTREILKRDAPSANSS